MEKVTYKVKEADHTLFSTQISLFDFGTGSHVTIMYSRDILESLIRVRDGMRAALFALDR